jgi:hypothetical protein
MLITGILSVIISIILKHWVGKRKFYRRNVAGIEEFKSYGSAVITDLLEKFVSFIAKVLIILGDNINYCFSSYFNSYKRTICIPT